MTADVATSVKSKRAKRSDLSEKPDVLQQTGVPIDKTFYLDHLWSAVIRVMTCVHEPMKCVMVEPGMSEDEKRTLKAHRRLFAKDLPHMQQVRSPIHARGGVSHGD